MKWNPKPYMVRAMRLMTTQVGAGQLLDPGMGKTSTTLGAFDILKERGLVQQMLVIAPIKPMYGTWPVEAQKWEDFRHLKVEVIHGPRKLEKLHTPADVHVINPEGLKWLSTIKPCDLPDWDVLAVDESTKFKKSTSKRSRMLKKMLPMFSYRWILTGTFSPNGLLDLFGQVYIMDQGDSLGKFITHYRNSYFYPSGYGGYVWSPFEGSMERIAKKVAPLVLKLEAEDYLDMPEFYKIIRPVTLPTEAMRQYKEVEREFITKLRTGTIVAANRAAAGTKCRQIANGAVFDSDSAWHHVHDAKMQAFEEIVEETNGHPLLIMYEFTHDKERIMEFLGKDAVCITGVTGKSFVAIQDRFNRGEIPYLIAHGGNVHGLNIHGHCFHMVWFGITWNLENYIQSIWRLYRQGQSSKMVLCYMLVATGTIDERVVEVLEHKERAQDELDGLLMSLGEA